jgi:hypothetical protein
MEPTASAPLPNRRHRYRLPDLGAFAEVNPRSAYWLGFLLADGCISRREVIVVLQSRDIAHLRALLEFLGCDDRPLGVANAGQAARLCIGSAALARQLRAFGLDPQHKHDSAVRVALATSRDFWRGVVDGDGSVKALGARRMPQLQLVGSPTVVSQFATFLGTVSSDGYVPRSFAHSQSQVVRLVSVSGRRAQGAIEALYGGEPRDALARKLRVARHAFSWKPLVRSSYPWNEWLDGQPRVLAKGVDYDGLAGCGRAAGKSRPRAESASSWWIAAIRSNSLQEPERAPSGAAPTRTAEPAAAGLPQWDPRALARRLRAPHGRPVTRRTRKVFSGKAAQPADAPA